MKPIKDRIWPMRDNVLIEVEALEERRSTGGIIIPESSSEFIREGIIVALGDDVGQLSVGDHVLCHAHSGVRMDMKKYGLVEQALWMISEDEILAKLDRE